MAVRKRFRVLMLLSNAFDPDPRVYEEARSLVQDGYGVTILCWDRDCKAVAYETIDGIKIERIYVRSTHGRGTSQILFLFLFWLKAYLKSKGKVFDIVHCHDFDTIPLGYLLSRYRRAKLVYDAHESYTDMLVNLPRCLKKILFRTENFFLKRIDVLITVGEILREAFASRGATNTCVVGNWKDPDKFRFSKEILEREKAYLKIPNGQLIISFIANLGMERQLPQLINAVKDVGKVFLIVGGDGPCKGIIEDAARKYSNIVYLGYVHPSKVPLYTALSDIIFYGFDSKNPNSRFSAPNKLFEALAAGKAIMTGDFGEIGKIVREAECGLILRNFSATEIKQGFLGLGSDRLNQFKKNALMCGLQKYNWQNAKTTLLHEYRCLCDK